MAAADGGEGFDVPRAPDVDQACEPGRGGDREDFGRAQHQTMHRVDDRTVRADAGRPHCAAAHDGGHVEGDGGGLSRQSGAAGCDVVALERQPVWAVRMQRVRRVGA